METSFSFTPMADVEEPNKKKRRLKNGATPEARASQFPESLHVFDQVCTSILLHSNHPFSQRLYCSLCSIPLCCKLDTIRGHFGSARHTQNSLKKKLIQPGVPVLTHERVCILSLSTFSLFFLQAQFCIDVVRCLAEADIPLYRIHKLKALFLVCV